MEEKVRWETNLIFRSAYTYMGNVILSSIVLNACILNSNCGHMSLCELSVNVRVGCMVDYTQSIRPISKRVNPLSMEEQGVGVL